MYEFLGGNVEFAYYFYCARRIYKSEFLRKKYLRLFYPFYKDVFVKLNLVNILTPYRGKT